jgi:dTDP-glucose pyrophosphorylase
MTTPAASFHAIHSAEETIRRFGVGIYASMRDVLSHIDNNGEGVAVVVGEDREFIGIVTDGDVRRAILNGDDFAETVGRFLTRKSGPAPGRPLTAFEGTPAAELLRLMDENGYRHLPLVDNAGLIAGLALISGLGREQSGAPPLRAVVMAGGFGQRLRPLTISTPKPLLTVGDKPVIERTIEHLGSSGVRNISVTTHYHAEKIMDRLGDGSALGVNVQYTHEKEPRGTAGALSNFKGGGETLLVINGDIITDINFRAMYAFHREQDSDLTVAVRKYEIPVPFGVIEAEGSRVFNLIEKPTMAHFINAGIYLLEPGVLEKIPAMGRMDMTDLIEKLLQAGDVVTSFPVHEYWLDIGRLKDYIQAQADAEEGKFGND